VHPAGTTRGAEGRTSDAATFGGAGVQAVHIKGQTVAENWRGAGSSALTCHFHF
jgi:hypothetical protein